MEVLQNFKDLFFDVWTKGISGVNISEVIIALAIFLFFLLLRGIFSKFVVKRLENYVSKSSNNFDNSLVSSMEGPAKFFPIVLGFFVSTSYLTIETQAAEFLETVNRSLITILIFWTFHQIIGALSVVIKSIGDLISRDLVNWIIKAIKVLSNKSQRLGQKEQLRNQRNLMIIYSIRVTGGTPNEFVFISISVLSWCLSCQFGILMLLCFSFLLFFIFIFFDFSHITWLEKRFISSV